MVTKDSHPALFEAFEIISHDSGNLAGWACYDTPPCWEPALKVMDKALANLDDRELQEFCIGESQQQEDVLNQGGDALVMAGAFLTMFFEQEWKRSQVAELMKPKAAINWLLQHLSGHLSVNGCECAACTSNPEEAELRHVKLALKGILS